tara:strand:- start:212 stop:406 length:195 start_codon:yes stop_codon:yes gene_type:complete
MITKKTNRSNMKNNERIEIGLRFTYLKNVKGYPTWQVRTRLVKEFGLLKTRKFYKTMGMEGFGQ